jgi:putative transposase
VLRRGGGFWQHENYDHVVRDEAELSRIVAYVLDNPVKAGLAGSRGDWEWSYSRYEV